MSIMLMIVVGGTVVLALIVDATVLITWLWRRP